MSGDQILQAVVREFFSPLYKVAVACSFLYFMYGVVRFIYNFNDPAKKNEGKSHLLWGLVGLFIIFSVGGILRIFNSVFGGMFTY
jgi:hypothetical protein